MRYQGRSYSLLITDTAGQVYTNCNMKHNRHSLIIFSRNIRYFHAVAHSTFMDIFSYTLLMIENRMLPSSSDFLQTIMYISRFEIIQTIHDKIMENVGGSVYERVSTLYFLVHIYCF